jgi:Fur family zinc uptake transcriptional regulator
VNNAIETRTALERVDSIFVAHEKQPTEKRCKLMAVLLDEEKPLSAYEITDLYNSTYGESIIATSVYRILNWLVEAQLVHRLNAINKYVSCHDDRCQTPSGFSVFIICKQCERTTESFAPIELHNQLLQGINNASFTQVTPHIELMGICDLCRPHQQNGEQLNG